MSMLHPCLRKQLVAVFLHTPCCSPNPYCCHAPPLPRPPPPFSPLRSPTVSCFRTSLPRLMLLPWHQQSTPQTHTRNGERANTIFPVIQKQSGLEGNRKGVQHSIDRSALVLMGWHDGTSEPGMNQEPGPHARNGESEAGPPLSRALSRLRSVTVPLRYLDCVAAIMYVGAGWQFRAGSKSHHPAHAVYLCACVLCCAVLCCVPGVPLVMVTSTPPCWAAACWRA